MNRKSRLLNDGLRVVVLDDDPTGIQTVQDCLVLTEWTGQNIAAALGDREPYFYILTNTRAFPPETVRNVIAQVTRSVIEESAAHGYRLVFICRSDSTLRSHFPLEMDTVIKTAHIHPDARFLVPAFFEGKRITIDDTHYIVDGDQMMPCHETEFARDATFGYSTAYLPGYVEEKTNGRTPRSEVVSLSRDLLRSDRQSDLSGFLEKLENGRFVVVNATCYEELDRFSDAVISRARVLGQAAPGVPVIRMPAEHRWAGMPYVIFPGNVGNDHLLKRVYRSFAG